MPHARDLKAKAIRAEVIRKLGGKCELCGATDRLEVDHVNGRDYSVEDMNSLARVRKYVKELEEQERTGKKIIRCLCKSCNVGQGNKTRGEKRGDLNPWNDHHDDAE